MSTTATSCCPKVWKFPLSQALNWECQHARRCSCSVAIKKQSSKQSTGCVAKQSNSALLQGWGQQWGQHSAANCYPSHSFFLVALSGQLIYSQTVQRNRRHARHNDIFTLHPHCTQHNEIQLAPTSYGTSYLPPSLHTSWQPTQERNNSLCMHVLAQPS